MDKDSYHLQEFGIRLAELRKQKGISQEKLALESGLARSYLSGVERGQRNISLLNIYKIADTLGIDIKCFFEMSNQKNK
ncbi:helix-turn-helix transcriptional regulator [Acinetobacter baumannii]|nr:helix-turn-helix transcriptional regulator [Acinetobacter baumannii]